MGAFLGPVCKARARKAGRAVLPAGKNYVRRRVENEKGEFSVARRLCWFQRCAVLLCWVISIFQFFFHSSHPAHSGCWVVWRSTAGRAVLCFFFFWNFFKVFILERRSSGAGRCVVLGCAVSSDSYYICTASMYIALVQRRQELYNASYVAGLGSICLYVLLCLVGLLYPCDENSFVVSNYKNGWKNCVLSGCPSAALALHKVRENFSNFL